MHGVLFAGDLHHRQWRRSLYVAGLGLEDARLGFGLRLRAAHLIVFNILCQLPGQLIISYRSLRLGVRPRGADLLLQLVEPVHGHRQSDVLGFGAPADVAVYIHLPVFEYFAHYIGGRHSLGAFCCLELAQLLHEGIAVLALGGLVRDVVVADEVDLVFVQEV